MQGRDSRPRPVGRIMFHVVPYGETPLGGHPRAQVSCAGDSSNLKEELAAYGL